MTPGQAARDAFYGYFGTDGECAVEEINEQHAPAWEAAAQAAIAAFASVAPPALVDALDAVRDAQRPVPDPYGIWMKTAPVRGSGT